MTIKIDERSIINEKNIFGQNTDKGNDVLEWDKKKEHPIKLFFTSPCHGGVDIHYMRAKEWISLFDQLLTMKGYA